MKPLFNPLIPNPARQTQIDRLKPPRVSYAIYFTPRSGSSRVTEILAQTKQLGMASEAFNPNFMPNIAQNVQAQNLDEYLDHGRRWLSRQDRVFSFEITDHQLRAVFPDTQKFFDLFAAQPCFWLIREDIVAQAVSLAKMVATNVAHTSSANSADIAAADQKFTYDRRDIKKWLKHILVAEENSEANFLAQGIQPRRLSYEQLADMTPEEVVTLFAAHLEFDSVAMPTFDLKHQRLGTGRNQEFADRFRHDEAAFLENVAAIREPWLNRLEARA